MVISRRPIRIVAVLALMAASTSACAQPAARVATIGRPAEVPVVQPAAGAPAGGFRYVEVTVKAFRPSADGPVQIIVEAPDGASRRELGRVGIYPELAFSATEPGKAQHFAFDLPSDLRLAPSTVLTVRIAPGRGSGEGAEVEVAPARLR